MQHKSQQINIMSALDSNCKIYPEYVWLHDKIKRHFDSNSTSSSIRDLHSGSTEKEKDSPSSSKRLFKKISISSISCVTKEKQSFTMPVSSR